MQSFTFFDLATANSSTLETVRKKFTKDFYAYPLRNQLNFDFCPYDCTKIIFCCLVTFAGSRSALLKLRLNAYMRKVKVLAHWIRNIIATRHQRMRQLWEFWIQTDLVINGDIGCEKLTLSKDLRFCKKCLKAIYPQLRDLSPQNEARLNAVIWLYKNKRAFYRMAFRPWFHSLQLKETERQLLLNQCKQQHSLSQKRFTQLQNQLAIVDEEINTLNHQKPRFNFCSKTVTIEELNLAYEKYLSSQKRNSSSPPPRMGTPTRVIGSPFLPLSPSVLSLSCESLTHRGSTANGSWFSFDNSWKGTTSPSLESLERFRNSADQSIVKDYPLAAERLRKKLPPLADYRDSPKLTLDFAKMVPSQASPSGSVSELSYHSISTSMGRSSNFPTSHSLDTLCSYRRLSALPPDQRQLEKGNVFTRFSGKPITELLSDKSHSDESGTQIFAVPAEVEFPTSKSYEALPEFRFLNGNTAKTVITTKNVIDIREPVRCWGVCQSRSDCVAESNRSKTIPSAERTSECKIEKNVNQNGVPAKNGALCSETAELPSGSRKSPNRISWNSGVQETSFTQPRKGRLLRPLTPFTRNVPRRPSLSTEVRPTQNCAADRDSSGNLPPGIAVLVASAASAAPELLDPAVHPLCKSISTPVMSYQPSVASV